MYSIWQSCYHLPSQEPDGLSSPTAIISLDPISEQGVAYLKTATASPDFDQLDDNGIPDDYSGKSVTIKEMFTTTVSLDDAKDQVQYIIVTPTPGIAYWKKSFVSGGTWSTGDQIGYVAAPTTGDLFDNAITTGAGVVGGSNSRKVDQGRCTCMAAELVAVNNSFNSYGTITAYRTPMAMTVSDTVPTGSYTNYDITGAGAFVEMGTPGTINNANAYVMPSKAGAYCVSMRAPSDAEFCNVLDQENKISEHQAWVGPAAAAPGNTVTFKGPIVFWDDAFDSIVFKIEKPAEVAAQSFILKIYKCYEYKPTFNSFPYQLAGHSAGYDPQALELYKQMARALPIAVPSKDNPDFWKTLLQTVNIGSGLLKGLPGLGGALAGGVHAVTSYLDRPGVSDIQTSNSVDGSGKVFVERNRSAKKERREQHERSQREDDRLRRAARPGQLPVQAKNWRVVPQVAALTLTGRKSATKPKKTLQRRAKLPKRRPPKISRGIRPRARRR